MATKKENKEQVIISIPSIEFEFVTFKVHRLEII